MTSITENMYMTSITEKMVLKPLITSNFAQYVYYGRTVL